MTLSKIDPDEIPEVPSNRFLYRGEKKKDEDEEKNSSKKLSPEEEDRMREKRRAQIRGRTKSGRIVKGRGLLVISFHLLHFCICNKLTFRILAIQDSFAEPFSKPDTTSLASRAAENDIHEGVRSKA